MESNGNRNRPLFLQESILINFVFGGRSVWGRGNLWKAPEQNIHEPEKEILLMSVEDGKSAKYP
jgi:hypothetical protein